MQFWRVCAASFPSLVSVLLLLVVPSGHLGGPRGVAAGHHRITDANPSSDDIAIVTPLKVSADGVFLSHDLRHHAHTPGLWQDRRAKRRRRETSTDEGGDGIVHYALYIDGKHRMVRLEPNSIFLAPHAVLERRSLSTGHDKPAMPGEGRLGPIHTHLKVLGSNPHCHLVGYIINETSSAAALSACDGLKGFVRTVRGEFLIEPVNGLNRTAGEPHPHKVTLKSDVQKETIHEKELCGAHKFSEGIKLREQFESSHRRRKKRRRRRSVSVERNVEALVVADKMMLDFYNDEDIDTYILTIMNMVSSIFHDASIGNAINIVVVRILLLETPQYEEELDISASADTTLASFCRWQQMVNPDQEDHPHHHDVAVLITRHNMCSGSSSHCSTLGLAEIAGMCQPQRSCNVNEDTGLQIAYTIAHEIGHNFGMHHDGPANGCGPEKKTKEAMTEADILYHVMSPQLTADAAAPATWSNCSRSEITTFLDREWGGCLVDSPSTSTYSFPSLPPGAMYDASHQCRLTFGAKAKACPGLDSHCRALWCKVKNRCVTRLEPAAEGTHCAKHKWCQHGECVPMGESPTAIPGSWGEWSSWGECSRSCGAGVETAQRRCDNPSPSNGGRYCTGDRRRYRICNTQDCPDLSVSFRAQQCSEFDDTPYKGNNHTWNPVTVEDAECELHCKPDNAFYSVRLRQAAYDGTPCRPGTRDMCIHGICKAVACDWSIEGSATEDRCGLCHGDGTQCVTWSGTFDVLNGRSYEHVVTVPEEARNVRVTEVANATNYLAVRDNATGQYFLNGNWVIQWSGEYSAGPGVTIYYKRHNDTEELFMPGPLKKPLTIMLLFRTANPGLTWEYTLAHENATYTPHFAWHAADWSVCTRTCGSGVQRRTATCKEKEAGRVDDKYCEALLRPSDETRPCNTHICPAWWWSGPWQPCDATCGQDVTRRRTVICVRSSGPTEQMALLDSDCDPSAKPREVDLCPDLLPCPKHPHWDAGPWDQGCASDPCGFETRSVRCVRPDGPCDAHSRPPSRRLCGRADGECGTWHAATWQTCSSTCGEGVQIRTVMCVEGDFCARSEEPVSVRECVADVTCDAVLALPDDLMREISATLSAPKDEGSEGDYIIQERDYDLDYKDRSDSMRSVETLKVFKKAEQDDNQDAGFANSTESDRIQVSSFNRTLSTTNEQPFISEDMAIKGTIFSVTEIFNATRESTTKLSVIDDELNNTTTNRGKNAVNYAMNSHINASDINSSVDVNGTVGFNATEITREVANNETTHSETEIAIDEEYSFTQYEETPDDYYDSVNSENAKTILNDNENNAKINKVINNKTKTLMTKKPNSNNESDTDIIYNQTKIYKDSIKDNKTNEKTQKVEELKNGKNETKIEGTVMIVHENLTRPSSVNGETEENLLSNDTKFMNQTQNNADYVNMNETFEESNVLTNRTEGRNDTKNDFLSTNKSQNVTIIETENKFSNSSTKEAETTMPEADIISKLKEESEVYNEIGSYSNEEYYDDFSNITESKKQQTTVLERPTGYATDSINVDEMQAIEVRLKKKKKGKKSKGKKTHRKGGENFPTHPSLRNHENEIKKVKIYTGKDALRVLKKFTKKASMNPLKSEEEETFLPTFLEEQTFEWQMGPWKQCSKECDGGWQERSIECQSSFGTVAPQWKCLEEAMPPGTQQCNILPCLNWTFSEWNPCSADCGLGNRSRSVSCPEERRCALQSRPPSNEPCESPCARWVEGPWSMCTQSCGSGYQIRFVQCVHVVTQQTSTECLKPKPPHKRECNTSKCKKHTEAQRGCVDSVNPRLCKRLLHLCGTKFFRAKCCRTCLRTKG